MYLFAQKSFELFQLGNAYLKIYDGGSDKDDLLTSVTGNFVPSPVTSLGNKMFIIFTSDSNGVGKGFAAKIAFGNIITTIIKEFIVHYLVIKNFLQFE